MSFSVLLHYLTPHRRVLVAILGLLLAGSLVSLLNPWIAGQFTQALMITHRPASLALADRILKLEKGQSTALL